MSVDTLSIYIDDIDNAETDDKLITAHELRYYGKINAIM